MFWCQRPFSSHGGPPWIQIEMSRARLKVNIFKLTRQCNFGIYIILRAKLGVHALGFSRPGCRRGEGFAGSFAAPLHSWSLQSFSFFGVLRKGLQWISEGPQTPLTMMCFRHGSRWPNHIGFVSVHSYYNPLI